MPKHKGNLEPAAPIEPRYLGLGELFYRISDAVIVGDAQTGRVILWNDAASRIFGYAQDEALGLHIEDLVPPALKDAHRKGLRRFATSGRGRLVDSSQTIELPAVRSDGTEIVVELTLTPLESDRLQGRYAMAIVRDVTDRKHSERLVQEALELEREVSAKLRDLDALKNTFVAMVAHDVRSPMSAVIGFTQLLRNEWDRLEPDMRKRFFDGIERSAETVSRLVEDVLQVAALESGEMPYAIRSFHLRTTVERVIEETKAARPEVTIRGEVPDALPAVRGDPERVWQILANLTANAVAFTPAGERIEISAQQTDDMVVVSIKDPGPGIADGDRAKLFEKFTRIGRESIAGGRRGTGLGLYLCRALVEAQDGRIWLEETPPGSGATFSFSLPIAGSEQEDAG